MTRSTLMHWVFIRAMEHFSQAKGVQQLGSVIERQARIGS